MQFVAERRTHLLAIRSASTSAEERTHMKKEAEYGGDLSQSPLLRPLEPRRLRRC